MVGCGLILTIFSHDEEDIIKMLTFLRVFGCVT
jgi:hypothetical protein